MQVTIFPGMNDEDVHETAQKRVGPIQHET